MIEIDPNSSILLEYICRNYTDTLIHLNPKSDCFKRIQSAYKAQTPLFDNKLLKDQDIMELCLFLILACMVFSYQTFESVCYSCRIERDTLHIVWNNTIISSIRPNMQAHQLKQFLTEARRHLFAGISNPITLSSVIHACNAQYKQNKTEFEETEALLESCLIHLNSKNDAPSLEQLFLLIGSAPNEIITQIYTELSQLVDTQLTIKTALSFPVKIIDIFQSNSPNLTLNFEKIKTHFNICFYHTDEAYRKKLNATTRELIWPILNQSQTKRHLKSTLSNTKDQVIQIYKQFFSELTNYTTPLINA